MSSKPAAKRRKQEQKEDISLHQFGEDFDNSEAMLNAEVKVVIDSINASSQLEFEDLSEMMQNSYTYVQTFGKFRDADSITLCKRELQEMGASSFEAASLGNLMPANADEAKHLISSLSRHDDQLIESFCNVVQRYKEA
mmetsp:Transcript_55891/g.114212  ORF Transcript_55891/g.114212 Transcript_55891/m.114212 type:complete len:139 (+) Transcript_55891:77-493(+)|eukprot:CAMPEP_0181323386 /NCGR_PEP_ID=MMETSP1101-20121128/19756_1 /TAXON_ID=46948 /ORGANISM="Rhodomonas abbreviata, Strain Caron Lab Isolate" /LENGTH=138 /DNA_ID=CAMNT_0023431407 /DNA_START=74 /DNA_END=490 /DNA_ORIENTATION=+